MPSARAWFVNNDVAVTMTGLRSSTMGSTAYLNNSSGLKVTIWAATSTSDVSKRLINAAVMGFVTGTNGNYRYTAQSTGTTGIAVGTHGLAILRLSTGGLNAEWRVPFNGEYRGTT